MNERTNERTNGLMMMMVMMIDVDDDDDDDMKGQRNLAVGGIAANWRGEGSEPKSLLHVGDRGPCLIQCYLGPHKCPCQMASHSLAGCTSVTEAHMQSDRPRYGNASQEAMPPNNNSNNNTGWSTKVSHVTSSIDRSLRFCNICALCSTEIIKDTLTLQTLRHST